MSDKFRVCDKHYNTFHEDEGCEYCYEIWKLISEFVDKLKNTLIYQQPEDTDTDDAWEVINSIIEEYEEKLK